MQTYYSNGKLLLTGEYVVLDGAISLAVPTTFGQSLTVTPIHEPKIIWKSIDSNGLVWFESSYTVTENEIASSDMSNNHLAERLLQILKAAKELNPSFLNSGFEVTTTLTFPRNWGLGSSSTLINNIAHWANVDAYKLLERTFGGSGYDIACAQHNTPLVYRLNNSKRDIKTVSFNPPFKDALYFVYLNKKQNSRDAIEVYRKNNSDMAEAIKSINKITEGIIACKSLMEFNDLITQHEKIIGTILKQEPIKNRLFNDFQGGIKSLGAWGGDFVLATSKENPSAYFKAKGFETVIPYKEMIL